MTEPVFTFYRPHWFEYPAIAFRGLGRRPSMLREWVRCGWNMDIFFGPVPTVKVIVAVSWIIAWLS